MKQAACPELELQPSEITEIKGDLRHARLAAQRKRCAA
jgi:hypothetical protein